ncbi:MAG: helix-turn-helix domain-containing protein [Promethearchaeati archaeon]
MTKTKNLNYRKEILETLEDHPFGLTITELSEKTGFHRNTISKYMSIFEEELLVDKREIAAASVYYRKQRKYIRKEMFVSFIKALLAGLKQRIPNKNEIFKEIGRIITEEFQFPIGDKYIEEFKRAKKSLDIIPKLKLFQHFYNSFDFFQDDLDIEIVELKNNKITFRLKNSEFLEPSGKFLYFFDIACGITEGIYLQNLNMKINCDVEDIAISADHKERYIDISIQISK